MSDENIVEDSGSELILSRPLDEFYTQPPEVPCGPIKVPPPVQAHFDRILITSRVLEGEWGSHGGMRLLVSNPEAGFIKIDTQPKEIPMDREELKKRKKEFQEATEIYVVLQCALHSNPPRIEQTFLYGKEELVGYNDRNSPLEGLSFRVFDFFTRQEIDLQTLQVQVEYKDS